METEYFKNDSIVRIDSIGGLLRLIRLPRLSAVNRINRSNPPIESIKRFQYKKRVLNWQESIHLRLPDLRMRARAG